MDVFYAYTYGTAAWMAVQAAPLILSPTIIAAMLSPQVREATTLEVYFSRALGIALLVIGILVMLLTGSVPLSSRLTDEITQEPGTTTNPNDPKAPYALPTLTVTMIFHIASAFYGYAMYAEAGVASFMLSTGINTMFAAIGLWCLLFASSEGRISRKTGADKRTSGFPFKNAEASKRKGKKDH